MSDGTGTPFGKYELLERLGAGGMAIVYRARYVAAPGITKPVVIKRVLREYAEEASFVEMFIHEARICVGLNHGNIVQVFDFGQVDGEYFLAMELVDGQPLSRVLKKATAMGMAQLPPPLAVGIAMELCKGLHHAHTRTDEKRRPLGVVHRDVSPDNVLISYEGEVKITDFGIAKAQLVGQPKTQSGVMKGKYRYFSPEQARTVPNLDARSDVYAVGVLLYVMLCGRMPAEGEEGAVLQRVIRGQLTPPQELNPDLDEELVHILAEALATDRNARTPDAEALYLQLSQWASVKTPLFPVHTLKHLMGLLYESELTAMDRPPQFPARLREQVALWSRSRRKVVPKTDTLPAVAWPGSAPAASVRPAPRGPKAEPSRPVRRASRPEQRVAAAPQAPARPSQADDTLEVTMDVTVPPSAKPVAPSHKPVPEPAPEPYARVTGALMGVPAYWFIIVGVLVLAGVGFKALSVLRSPPLMIVSEPPGARVSLDRKEQGVTPLEVEGVSRKEPHTVELSLPGRKTWSGRFQAGMLGEQLQVILEPLKPVAVTKAPEVVAPSGPAASTRVSTDGVPAKFLLEESWHVFSAVARSLREPLDEKRTYSVWLSGSFTGEAPVSEQDMQRGLRSEPIHSTQVYVFLEGTEVSPQERLIMLSATPHTVASAQGLDAFVLGGTSAERNVDQELTLHVRDTVSKKVVHRRLDTRQFSKVVAPESRYTVRQLDAAVSYTVDIRAHEGAQASALAMLVVPGAGGAVEVTGQGAGDFRYALPPGRYTVRGARELWFVLPRWQHEGGPVQMEVSVNSDH